MSVAQNLHHAEAPLPTLSKLGDPIIPTDLDTEKIAAEWLSSFAKFVEQGDINGILSLILDSQFSSNIFKPKSSKSNDQGDLDRPDTGVAVYWRDVLALTWDFRTFEGTPKIKQFLVDRLGQSKISNVQSNGASLLMKPYPDLAWIQLSFTFETQVGLCSGIVRLVPVSSPAKDIVWKAHSIFSHLDDLKGFPEKIGALRNPQPNHGKWEAEREKEARFEDKDPVVLIVGGGHSGLAMAARLKALDISSLVIDKNERVGDNWRTRYEALCLHDPVWYDHMPYLSFPTSWPVYSPAKKIANWLEHYAEAMELNVWTSSTVINSTQDPTTKLWSVTVKQQNGKERVFKVKHVVLALGFKGGQGYIPSFPGKDTFKGQVLHSLQHDKATQHIGKKVVVVGACTSAHDICVDYADHGVDVTMFQRSSTYVMSTKNGIPMLLAGLYEENGPPTDVADKISASFPNLMMAGLGYRVTKLIAKADKEILDGLHQRGFRTNMGYQDTGLLLMVWLKAGGYYMDVGGSQYIIDGKVKLKNGSQIQGFTANGLKFEDGSELEADVVLFCTGLSDTRHAIRKVCGDEVAEKMKPVWGLDEEGELNGCYRDLGYQGLWYIMGNFALSRFYSKHMALQIKAMEEGIFGERYSLAA
ncbi:FAD/NAD(P)-binding domain-containing protein [Phlegmacium glaucopus]|nr:FAD/NAD(P)-binding domain-containing protein [Phlegmacium glaucopus]